MCTRARPYGRVGRCGFGGRGVTVLHHRALLLLRRLGPDGRGSYQLCTTNLVGGVAKQVVQLKLQWWCVASVVVLRSRWLKQWLLNR
jgi:hypothetical protein